MRYLFSAAFAGILVVLPLGADRCLQAEPLGVLESTILLQGFTEDTPVVTSVAIHPTDALLATAGDDHLVRLWDLRTGRLQRTLHGHGDWVTSVAFSGNGRQLVTGGRDRQLLTWNLRRKSAPVSLGTHRHPISGMAHHPPTKRLAVSGFRAPLKVFHAETQELLHELRCPCLDTRALAFSPDGQWLAAGGRNGKLRIWNLTSGKTFDLPGHQRRITSVVFASDELVISAGEGQRIHAWNVTSKLRQHSITHDAGKVLAMTMLDDTRFAIGTAQNVIVICDLRKPEPLGRLQGHTGSVAALVSRNDRLVSGSFDTTVRIWKLFLPRTDSQAAVVRPTLVLE